ncbi:MAG: hypothetical protein RL338_1465 [Chloroflexota bacterium]
MSLDYEPGDRWVRVLATDRVAARPIGRWHLSSDRPDRTGTPRSAVVVVCGRVLRGSARHRTELLFIGNRPFGNVCETCDERWFGDQPSSLTVRRVERSGSAAVR